MKYRVECKSLLLQKALEEFLKEYLSDEGIVISDENGDIVIGKDIKKPFSKSQLLLQLESLNQKTQIKESIKEEIDEKLEIDINMFEDILQKESINNLKKETKSFDEKLDNLIDEFSLKLKQLIKEEYGKK